MRMLCCPTRSPFKASSRFPGGTRRSPNRPAISNCRNLRRATAEIFANRPTCSPFESASVSEHLNVLITGHNSNAERDYRQAWYPEYKNCAYLCQFSKPLPSKPGTKNGNELDVLTTLVEAYATKHHVIYPPNPVEAIKFRMDQLGMTRKDLEAMLGGRGRVSEILTKKRGLSLEMIRRLHRELHIPLESLVGTAA